MASGGASSKNKLSLRRIPTVSSGQEEEFDLRMANTQYRRIDDNFRLLRDLLGDRSTGSPSATVTVATSGDFTWPACEGNTNAQQNQADCLQVDPDGRWWISYLSSLSGAMHYSEDSGVTWTPASAGADFGGIGVPSRFCGWQIDAAGYAYIVYVTGGSSVFYKVGTPSGGGTGWTWSSALDITPVTAPAAGMTSMVFTLAGTTYLFYNTQNTSSPRSHYLVIVEVGDPTSPGITINAEVLLDSPSPESGMMEFDRNPASPKEPASGSPKLYVWSNTHGGTGDDRTIILTYSGSGVWAKSTTPTRSGAFLENTSHVISGDKLIFVHPASAGVTNLEVVTLDTVTETYATSAVSPNFPEIQADATNLATAISVNSAGEVTIVANLAEFQVGGEGSDYQPYTIRYSPTADAWGAWIAMQAMGDGIGCPSRWEEQGPRAWRYSVDEEPWFAGIGGGGLYTTSVPEDLPAQTLFDFDTVEISNNLTVDGKTTLNGGLISAGLATFQQQVTLNGPLRGTTAALTSATITTLASTTINVGTINATGTIETDGLVTAASLAVTGEYTLPTADGTVDQIMSTNGAGVLSWVDVTTLVHAAVTLDANADTLLSLSTQELGLDTQLANTVLAGATSGAAAVPAFRSLVVADIPDLSATYLVDADIGVSVLAFDTEVQALADLANGAGILTNDGAGVLTWGAAGAGDVVGPGSATDNAIARYDSTTGKLLQDSTPTIADTGATSIPGIGDGALTSIDLKIGDTTTPDYGIVQVGNSFWGRTNNITGSLDLDGALLIWNAGGPVTGQIEIAFAASASAIRFAIPKSGAGNATYNARSMLLAGPAVLDDDIVTVGYWQGVGIFDNLACDTGTDGADLGVQNDLEVEGDIFVDSILESTTAAGVTIDGLLIQDGSIPAGTLAIGDLSDADSDGTNMFLGSEEPGSVTTADDNLGISTNGSALGALTDGVRNIAIGLGALDALTTGDRNFALGRSAGGALISGSDNVLVGNSAGITSTTGIRNIIFGISADVDIASRGSIVAIGYNVTSPAENGSIVIGNDTNNNQITSLSGVLKSHSLAAEGDIGSGAANETRITNATDTPTTDPGWTTSSTVDMNAPDGYARMYVGTQAIVVPYWNT